MQLYKDTHTQQSRLAGYCRIGELKEIKGLTEGRIHHYRRLVYNVVNDTLQSAFPLTFDLLSEEEWDNSVNNFFSTHACQSYQVWKMPYEFYEFVKAYGGKLNEKYSFLIELLLFEWTEIEIYMMEDIPSPRVKLNGDWKVSLIELNPEFEILQLKYPVHLKNANSIVEQDKGDYYVLIFREQNSGRVQFVNLSFYFAWLLNKINNERKTIELIISEAENIFNVDKQTLLKNTVPFLEELKDKQFILGFSK